MVPGGWPMTGQPQHSGPITFGPPDFVRGALSTNKFGRAGHPTVTIQREFTKRGCVVCKGRLPAVKSLADRRTKVRFCSQRCRRARHHRTRITAQQAPLTPRR